MSLFQSSQIACPLCRSTFSFDVVHSVNADRRPALRDAILTNEFQRMACPKCGERFRLAPSFTYLDVAHDLWIVAAPVTGLAEWQARENTARALFARSYGDDAPEAARDLGGHMRPRITFGWPALREKILITELGLDDVVVEACKAALMRTSSELPFSPALDLRLLNIVGDKLLMVWQRSADGRLGDAMGVPKKLYDAIAANVDGRWSSLRDEFAGALFVDLNRMLIEVS
jgi:hypothetical protein